MNVLHAGATFELSSLCFPEELLHRLLLMLSKPELLRLRCGAEEFITVQRGLKQN